MKSGILQIRRVLRCVLLVLLLSVIGLTKSFANYYVTIGDLNYCLYVNTLTATVTGHKNGTTATGSLTIPSSVTYTSQEYVNGQYVPVTRTYSVTSIGNSAFSGCSGFTGSLTIGNSVITIGGEAFSGCSGFTGSLTIPNSVTTIGWGAFYNCNGFNGTLSLGSSLNTIGTSAFWGCDGFSGSLTIPNSVMSIHNAAFANCSGFTGDLTISNSVTEISEGAFYHCSGFTGDLTIPNTVIEIGGSAFKNCSGFDGTLTIPSSVTEISCYAFENCSGLAAVYYNANAEVCLSPFGGCGGILTIGDNVDTIPEQLFAFAAFTGSLIIPNSVTSIGYEAFAYCSGFTGSLTIGNSVTSIGSSAFEDCGFSSVYYTGSIAQWCNISFEYDSSNPLTYAHNLYVNNQLVTNLVIPESVTEIKEYAFYGATCLTSLTIGNNVASIGKNAFNGCSGLTSLTIGSSVTSIGYNAFNGCSGLTELYYNASNATYNGSFSWDVIFDCPSLLLVVFGENVESLPNNSLFGYYYNTPLQFIKSYAMTPPIVGGSNTFSDINRNTPVIVACGALEAYQAAPYWSEFANIRESEYGLAVKANPEYLGSAIIIQEPDCNSSHASVRAIPNPGCRFINWTCNGEEVSDNRNYSLDMEEDMVLTANFETHKRFVGTVSQFWLDPENWEPAGMPNDTMSVDIQSNVVIDTDVTVGSVFVHDGYVLTIMPDATLTVTEALEVQQNSWNYNIVIEDGGQLIHPNENVYATVKKTVKEHDEIGDNWNFLALPLSGSGYISSWGIQNLISNEYDLYYYDEPTQYWNNYRQTDNGFNYLNAGQGYLYANSGNMEITPVGNQIGEGSGTALYSPFNTDYDNSISENLFHADELAATGLGTEPLGALCWYATNTYGYEQNNISIWIANVSDSELTGNSHITSNMTLVYTGNMTPTLGWNEFVFNEGSFAWDGTSNLVVCVQKNGGWWDYVYWQNHETDFVSMSYAYTYGSAYDMTSQTYSMSTSYSRPNIVFENAGQLGTYENHPVTLSFSGQLQSGTATVSLPLSYTEGIEHPGYNLVGNPYVHNVTSYASENVAEGCYRMNEAQDEIIVSEISEAHPLKPAEGFFVKATGENASITFNPQANSKANYSSSIYLEITENGQLIDRLIMKKEGEPLEKLSLNKEHTKLFVTEEQRELAIVPIKDNEQKINFKAVHNGTYTLWMNNEGMEVNYLHLIDNLTGEDMDLLANPTFSFNASTDDPVARFTVVFDLKH